MTNRTFRLFISSTFNDFLLERQILSENVYKVVGDYCQRRGYSFQLVDLRWGISEEAALNQKTLPICLDEVRRCHKWSPKPNFLLMVGERYGWIPLPYAIKKAEFEALLYVCSLEERKLLEQWYCFDGNTIDEEYYLRPRQGEYERTDKWNAVQDRLRSVLVRAAEMCLHESTDLIRYTASATEQEIIEGFLGNPDVCDNTIAVFRNRFPEKDSDSSLINNLRSRIREKMLKDGVISSLYELDYGEGYSQLFSETITSALLKNIEKEIDRLEEEKSTYSEDAELSTLPPLHEGVFFGRLHELDLLNEYVCGREQRPLFVTGKSGSGKTSLLAEFIRRTERKCFFSFYGANDTSYTIYGAISAICHSIRKAYSINSDFFITPYNLHDAFRDTIISIPSSESIIILIDGIDMFPDQIKAFNPFLLPNLPENIKLIVSFATDSVLSTQITKNHCILQVSSFELAENHDIFGKMLRIQGHCLADSSQEGIVNSVLEKNCLPLQLRLMADICSSWRSGEKKTALPETPEAVALYYIVSMFEQFGHDREFVLYSLAFILAAPFGLGEDDLQILLAKVSVVRERFAEKSYYSFDATKIPLAIWSRLFYDLEKCLRLVEIEGFIVVQVSHNVFHQVFLKQFPKYYEEAKEILISHYLQMSNYSDNVRMIPNRKKCLSILPLLQSADKTDDVDYLLQDISFLDATCKSGNLESVLLAYHSRILQMGSTNLRNKFVAIETCLLRNRKTLDYYRGNLFACLESAELNHTFVPTISYSSGTTSSLNNLRPFPYSSSSRLAWSINGSLLAVGHGRYVHILNADTYEELQNIYVGSSQPGAYSISSLLWPGPDFLAVHLTNQVINLYRVEAAKVEFAYSIENAISENALSTLYDMTDGEGLLLYYKISGGNEYLCAVDVYDEREIYSIPHSTGNNVSIIGDSLFVTGGFVVLFLDCYDVHTGEKQYRNTVKRLPGLNTQNLSLIQLPDNKWVLLPVEDADENHVTMLKETRRRSKCALLYYFYPPQQGAKILSYLGGQKSVIVVYQNRLIWIALSAEFPMFSFIAEDIVQVVWKKKDEVLCVLCRNYCLEVTRDEFLNSKSIGFCFVEKKELVPDHRKLAFSASMLMKAYRELVEDLCSFRSIYKYSSYFAKRSDTSAGNIAVLPSATLLVFSPDGKYAIAYEGQDEIVLYDNHHNPLFFLRKMQLSIINSILKMEFSSDSHYFFVWCNSSIEVFFIDTGRRILKLNLSWRPALFVSFSDDSHFLGVVLCDGKKYSYRLTDSHAYSNTEVPKRLIKSRHFRYTFPYIVNPFSEKPEAIGLVSEINDTPSKWFKSDRLYFGKHHYLLFKDGNFYLDGDTNMRFSALSENFTLALQAERLSDHSALEGFLREKNDISSIVLEVNDGKQLILISRMLNSVIVFDVNNMQVISAYKHHGNIIGWRIIDNNDEQIQLGLFSNVDPFFLTLTLHFSRVTSLPNDLHS